MGNIWLLTFGTVCLIGGVALLIVVILTKTDRRKKNLFPDYDPTTGRGWDED
jgi:hypothetical protein